MHLRLERAGEFLLCNEGMGTRLLRGPSLQRVDVEQTMDKVNESNAVVHF